MNKLDSIRIYGSDNNEIPQVKPSIEKLFGVPAPMYMLVPFEYLEDIIKLLTATRYVYKTRQLAKYAVFALQYQKV